MKIGIERREGGKQRLDSPIRFHQQVTRFSLELGWAHRFTTPALAFDDLIDGELIASRERLGLVDGDQVPADPGRPEAAQLRQHVTDLLTVAR